MNEEVEITLLQEDVSVETPLVADYILPTATESILGGVKIGDNINIDSNGHISIPVASQSSLGVVQAGTGINIDANGVISANGEGYTLPEATKTTLGGVYVDDELSTTSTHPVQNTVVSLELEEIEGDVSDLDTAVTGINTTVGNLSTTVGNLGTTVTNLSGTVTNQGNDISTIQGNINIINSNIKDINEDLTNTGNALTTLQGTVDPLVVNYDETINGTTIDNTIWTNGDIRIYRRGRTGVIYVNLEGSLTIADGTSEIIHTIADSDNFPVIESIGFLSSDAGWLETVINTDGEIVVYNNSGSSITLTELKGNIPVVWL
jgi:hypothetical protein